jgi:hypothetical protein
MRNGDVARITIVAAVRTDTVTTTAFGSAPKNGTYLLLDVLWETEAGKTSSNPLDFSAKDASGRKADLNMFADNQLGSGDDLPGDNHAGSLPSILHGHGHRDHLRPVAAGSSTRSNSGVGLPGTHRRDLVGR